MDQPNSIQFSQTPYANLSSAAKASGPSLFFNIDNTNLSAVQAVAAAATSGKVPHLTLQASFNQQGNEKFDWGSEINVGALASPNIFQQKHTTLYTPLMTGGAYSSFGKGQNFFNFSGPVLNDDTTQLQQMNGNGGVSVQNQANPFAGTPHGIPQIYGDNLNQIYSSASQLTHPSNYGLVSTPNKILQGQSMAQNQGVEEGQFGMENPYQFIAGLNGQNSGNKNIKQIINNGCGNAQNIQNDYLNLQSAQKMQTPNGNPSQFQTSQFAHQQQQQNQSVSQQQQFQGFSKNTFMNQNDQCESITSQINSAPTQQKKKPILELLQIPQGNSIAQSAPQTINLDKNNNGLPSSASHNPNNQFSNYFSSYQHGMNFPFTPMQLQQLGSAPQSSHIQYSARNNSQYPDTNYFFSGPTSYQQIPDSYQLMTPSANTSYQQRGQQHFFINNPSEQQPLPSPFYSMTPNDQQNRYQQQQTPLSHPNQLGLTLQSQMTPQHPKPIQQQQQPMLKQEHLTTNTNNNDNNNNNQFQDQNKEANITNQPQQQQNEQKSVETKKKPQNLKLDISSVKDPVPPFDSAMMSSKTAEKKAIDEDKDQNILSMLQKNGQPNSLSNSSFVDAQNVSLIIDFYQKANPEKKQQLFEFLQSDKNSEKDNSQNQKAHKIIEYILSASTKRIGTLTLQQRNEKLQKYREKRLRRSSTSLVKYEKQRQAVSKKPRDKNGKFLKQLDEEVRKQKKIKKIK